MALDLRTECTFHGPALPEPFVLFELERELAKLGLLPKTSGAEGQALQSSWEAYRARLRELAIRGGTIRVRNHVVTPLVERLGYAQLELADDVETREGQERGGELMVIGDGASRLRVWSTDLDEDLDAPARRGAAWRYSHLRIAQRVLLACGERVGLLTNGVQLRLLLSDPARPDSEIAITIDPGWKRSREAPDSYRLLLALASPAGVRALPGLIEKARLQQARVTKELRGQARQAVERFVQEVLDHPDNRAALPGHGDRARLAHELWREGLVTVYRLLFILKLESSDDPARAFTFASTSLWRNTFSPSVALAQHARAVLDHGAETGRLLEDGLRTLFRMFAEGLQCTELNVQPLGGTLFGAEATPILSGLRWGERAAALMLDRLLWTTKGTGGRQRVHYGPLDVEDLGRVYEALLELDPGIAPEPMCRLRRQKLEVVVPLAQGERYRETAAATDIEEDETEDAEEDSADEAAPAAKKTRVEWIEEIRPGQFYLRVGLGRKATGSYYTPHSFVRFLVQETLGPQVADRSPQSDPRPGEILKLKVLDPAMGSGHFLVEACRFLGRALYEACRLCDERALTAERRAENAKNAAEREPILTEAGELRRRLAELPDPDQELVRYLPSRAPEGQESGLSQRKAEALCRRLVAVHCLYGVDKNPLAGELAKLALWIESHAEGLPLTFLDHRLVVGDSLTGPFFEHLLTYPGAKAPMDDLFSQGMRESFTQALGEALKHVQELEASAGATLAEVAAKQAAKVRLDRALAPFRIVAAAWAGGAMLGSEECDDAAYAQLVHGVGAMREMPATLTGEPRLVAMIARGLGVESPGSGVDVAALLGAAGSVPALPYDFTFAEVFFPLGMLISRSGFDAVISNPPWDAIQFKSKEFFATFDFEILNAPTKRERAEIERRLQDDSLCAQLFERYTESFEQQRRANDALYRYQKIEVDGDLAGRQVDAFRVFMERNASLLGTGGLTGVVVPSAFHANEGATGIRRLYLERMALRCCYSFENRRKLFEIDSRFKFALVVASRGGPTDEFPCAFYLHDDEWLFGDRTARAPLLYMLEFVRQTGGEYLSFLELRSSTDAEIAALCFGNGQSLAAVCARSGIRLGAECHMTNDAWRFTPIKQVLSGETDPREPEVGRHLLALGYLAVHEGKTFRQYDDHWGDRPRYVVAIEALADKPGWIRSAQYYRLAYRNIAGPGDQNVAIWNLHPAGVATGEKGPTESAPERRPNYQALRVLAVANSFVFDWLLQLRVRATVSQFMLFNTPFPRTLGDPATRLCAHSALRLASNHEGYAPLWREQLDKEWREPKSPFTWPVLDGDDARWAVRAAIDALVADAYGLTRQQYTHVLSTFSHKSYPKAPTLCLERFHELKSIGLEAFTRKYDPYWDIRLNENLPRPVIDIPMPGPPVGVAEQATLYRVLEDSSGFPRAAERPAPYRVARARKRRASQKREKRDR